MPNFSRFSSFHCRLAVLLPLAVSVLSACQKAVPYTPPFEPRATQVKLIKVIELDVDDSSRYLATLKSRKAVPLKPQVAGTISQILVRSGDRVQKGSVLITLDTEKQQATVNSLTENTESLKAEKSTAEANLKSLQSTHESKSAQADFARKQLERYTSLLAQGAVSKEQVDQKSTDLRMALAELSSNENQIKAQENTIAKTQKQINQSKAAIQEQQAQLRYFTIRAPFAGVVGDIPVHVGEYVNTDSQLTSVNDIETLEVYIDVPTARSTELKNGLPVRLLDNNKNILAQGRVFFISPQVNSDNQSILVKAVVDNKNDRLRSGQFLTAEVIWKKTSGLLVPSQSLCMLAGQAFVYEAKDDGHGGLIARQKSVEPAEIIGNNYHILSGLSAKDRIVYSGVQNLVDGMPIESKEK
jgi:multidrug efflux pump subunit AcrA (membrane-fusion protein)